MLVLSSEECYGRSYSKWRSQYCAGQRRWHRVWNSPLLLIPTGRHWHRRLPRTCTGVSCWRSIGLWTDPRHPSCVLPSDTSIHTKCTTSLGGHQVSRFVNHSRVARIYCIDLRTVILAKKINRVLIALSVLPTANYNNWLCLMAYSALYGQCNRLAEPQHWHGPCSCLFL